MTLDPARRRPAHLIVAAAAVLGGVLLLVLATPRLLAAIELLDARSIAERVQLGDPALSPQRIEQAAMHLRYALDWQEDPDLAALLASVRLTQAGQAETPDQSASRLAQAIEAAKRAIRLSPAHPTAWALLALALEASNARDPQFPQALQQAIAVAPYDPRYLNQRIEMACRHWHRIDAPTRRLTAAQIRLLAGRDLKALAVLARRSYGLQPVREALAANTALLDQFDAIYMALP
jgi:tetratricopeptide (TPR) repeat protein